MPSPESRRTRNEVTVLLDVLDRAWDRASWHGVNLRGSLRRVDAAGAAWRPHPSRHNVWETAVHCAYWKYAVWRRLTGARRGSFPLEGSDWFRRPVRGASGDAAWRDDIALLVRMHDDLRTVVAGLAPTRLRRTLPGGSGRTTVFETVAGIAAHDLYHAGQIQLLKVLRKARASR